MGSRQRLCVVGRDDVPQRKRQPVKSAESDLQTKSWVSQIRGKVSGGACALRSRAREPAAAGTSHGASAVTVSASEAPASFRPTSGTPAPEKLSRAPGLGGRRGPPETPAGLLPSSRPQLLARGT